MKATYTISEADYVGAQKLHSRLRARHITILLLILLICVSAILFGPQSFRSAAVSGLVGGLSALILMPWLLTPMLAKRHYRKYKSIQDPITIDLRDDGVEFTTAAGEGLLRWDKLLKWSQNDRYLLLYSMPNLYHIIPKSIAGQGFDLDALLDALNTHLGKPS